MWEIEIKNLSGGVYEVFPAYQSYISQLVGGATGTWGAKADAAVEAGLSVAYETVGLAPGETRNFTLAGFIPNGTAPDRVTFMLDPNTRPTPPPHLPGSNALIWRTETNPYCGGDNCRPAWRCAASAVLVEREATMTIIDDVLRGLQIQIDTLWYNLLFSLAGLGWSVQRAFLMMGYTIELMNQWLVDQCFHAADRTDQCQPTNRGQRLVCHRADRAGHHLHAGILRPDARG